MKWRAPAIKVIGCYGPDARFISGGNNDDSRTLMKRIKRITISIIGGTVLTVGVALLVLPGPAFLVIPAGLAILAIEFAWARQWLQKTETFFRKNKPSTK